MEPHLCSEARRYFRRALQSFNAETLVPLRNTFGNRAAQMCTICCVEVISAGPPQPFSYGVFTQTVQRKSIVLQLLAIVLLMICCREAALSFDLRSPWGACGPAKDSKTPVVVAEPFFFHNESLLRSQRGLISRPFGYRPVAVTATPLSQSVTRKYPPTNQHGGPLDLSNQRP